MTAIATAVLVVLILTSSINVLPVSWQNGLWGTIAPRAVFDAKSLPDQPVQASSRKLKLGAKGSIAIDIESGTVLYAKDADAMRPIASLVKLAGAAVIVSRHSLNETVTVPRSFSYPQGAVALGIGKGQRFKLGQLLAAALVPSANDAADVLAIYDTGSIKKFAKEVNAFFRSWGVSGVKITDANGLSESSQASPRALAKVAELALANTDIARLVNKEEVTVKDLAGTKYRLSSTNRLLKDSSYDGIKTGFTDAAGQSLIALAKVDGHQVITVVLDSPDRFGETKKLVGHIKSSWDWR